MRTLQQQWGNAIWLPFAQLFRHRVLTWELTRREIYDRYAGQAFGGLWTFGHPLLLVGLYLVIFQFVFKVRLDWAGTPIDYTVYLLSGILPWLACQEAMNKGATALTANANLVKQVVFPIEVLPVKCVFSSLTTQILGMGVMVVYLLCTQGTLSPLLLLTPILWVVQCAAMIGAAMMLSAIGAYFRDVKELVQVFGTVGMYLAPIAYAPESVPPLLKPLLYCNPFSYMIWCYQDAQCFGSFAHWWAWPVFCAGGFLTLLSGYYVFRKAKVFVGNVV